MAVKYESGNSNFLILSVTQKVETCIILVREKPKLDAASRISESQEFERLVWNRGRKNYKPIFFDQTPSGERFWNFFTFIFNHF